MAGYEDSRLNYKPDSHDVIVSYRVKVPSGALQKGVGRSCRRALLAPGSDGCNELQEYKGSSYKSV